MPRRCIFGHSGSPLSSLPKTARCSNPAVEMEFVEEFLSFADFRTEKRNWFPPPTFYRSQSRTCANKKPLREYSKFILIVWDLLLQHKFALSAAFCDGMSFQLPFSWKRMILLHFLEGQGHKFTSKTHFNSVHRRRTRSCVNLPVYDCILIMQTPLRLSFPKPGGDFDYLLCVHFINDSSLFTQVFLGLIW